MRKKLLFLLLIFTVPCLSASGPNTISYQGRLRESGQPVSGTRAMQFKVYDAASGGAVVFDSDPQSLYVSSGVFGYQIGSSKAAGFPNFKDLEWATSSYWLEISVGGNAMSPREQINAMPYAFMASTAASLNGSGNIRITGAGNHYIANGSVGIGTISPAAKLHVNDTADSSQAYIRASNFNPVPTSQWPSFDSSRLTQALWVGWDDTAKVWKYNKQSDAGLTDPGNPNTWAVNGANIGYFDGDLSCMPVGTHINNRYYPKMMAYKCNQDDIQVRAGGIWVDKYPCRIIDVGSGYSGTTLIDDPADGGGSAQTISPFYMAFSQKVQCSTGMTWFVAAAAAANAGKRLLSNSEWAMAAGGTARSSGNGQTGGDTWASVGTTDMSRYGCAGMAGNVWEWIADWGQYGPDNGVSNGESSITAFGSNYGTDGTWNIAGAAYTTDNERNEFVAGLPAAILRGGYWNLGNEAGVFAYYATHAPSRWSYNVGFRTAR